MIFFEKLEQKIKIKVLLNYKQFTLKEEKEIGKYKKKFDIVTKMLYSLIEKSNKFFLQENVIKVIHKDKTHYMSCNVRPNLNESLCIGTTFARSLNIEEGDEVIVSFVKNVPILIKINVAPLTANDREILVGFKKCCNKILLFYIDNRVQ